MCEIGSTGPKIVPPPDNIALPEFILNSNHPARPARGLDVPCLIDDVSGRLFYLNELKERTNKLSKAIEKCWGIGDHDVVCISSPNQVDYAVACWAVHQLGGIVATVNPSLTAQELEYQLGIVTPSIIFAHSSTLPVVLSCVQATGCISKDRVVVLDKASQELGLMTLEDLVVLGTKLELPFLAKTFVQGEARRRIAFLCFSSGTTGNPKAVAISHYNVIYNITQIATFHRLNEEYTTWDERRFRPGDRCSGVLPFFHIYGLVVNLHLVIFGGMSVVVTAGFNFEMMLQNIVKYRINHLLIVPTQAVLFCKHPAVKSFDLSCVRCCMMASAPVSAELTTQLLEVMPNIHLGQGYGMTETCAAVTTFPTTPKVGTLGSGGQLVSGTTAKVVKLDGTLAKIGEMGELWVKGDQVVLGYYNNEKATRETFIDGWVRTGDEVYFAENGDLFIVDRLKEILKVKGHQVAPSELEGHLLTHPDVNDAGVVGQVDEYAGEIPVAFVVLKLEAAKRISGNASAAEAARAGIKEHVASAKSRYKWLGAVHFVDAIPKNPSGKILRRVLRQELSKLGGQTDMQIRGKL